MRVNKNSPSSEFSLSATWIYAFFRIGMVLNQKSSLILNRNIRDHTGIGRNF
mgnify:CR=1 FL=1